MLNVQRILVSPGARAGLGVAALSALMLVGACGQRGPLYLPIDPAATQRATLPQAVIPQLPRGEASDSEDRDAEHSDTTVPAPGVGAPAGGAR